MRLRRLVWRGQLYWLHLCLSFKEKVHGHSKVMNVDHRPAAPQVRKYRIDTCIIYLQMQAHGLCWLMSGKTVFTFFVLPMGLISAENGCLCFQVAVSSICSTSTEVCRPYRVLSSCSCAPKSSCALFQPVLCSHPV